MKKNPQFFKIILPSNINEKKLGLPPLFARSFSDECSIVDVARLSVGDGHIWKVSLEKVEANKIFLHGSVWNDFVQHYSINVGQFLVFKYKGRSNFQISIFDTTACEIDYPMKTRSKVVKIKRGVKMIMNSLRKNKPSKVEIIDLVNNTSISKKKPGRGTKNGLTMFTRSKEAEITVSQNFMEAYQKIMHKGFDLPEWFKPTHPTYLMLMTNNGLRRRYGFVIALFERKYIGRDLEHMTIKNVDGTREWSMKVVWRASGGLVLSTRWINFMRDSDLKEGDVCAFELVEKDVFKVSVFPASA
ncbi:hypothetical protein ACFE04_009258 [Oxalis oulophora]